METTLKTQHSDGDNSEWLGSVMHRIDADPSLLDRESLFDLDAFTSSIGEMKRKFDREMGRLMVLDYLKEVRVRDLIPAKSKLGLDFQGSCLMVWLEIDEKDLEEKYVEIENTLNAKYNRFDYYISSSILMNWDGIPCPDHYTPYPSI